MSSAKKATIYIDIDDEITTIIDKVISSKDKIVALVLPKRAAVLQSVVNMKLLKRSTDEAKKKIVLITSEAGILPLAGIAGVHVAKTLQSKPVIPKLPDVDEAQEELGEDIELDKHAPIGALAGDEVETAEIAEVTDEPKKAAAKKAKKGKKFKIPDFNKFRLKLVLAGTLLVLLIVGWVFAAKVLPKATIVIKTDTKTASKSLSVPAFLTLPEETEGVTALQETIEKADTETVSATGEKNVGKVADGTMALTNCIKDDNDHTVPKGASFTKDGKTFVTTEAVTLNEASFNFQGECKASGGSQKNVDVQAIEGGTSYNISEGAYNSSIAGITAYGGDMKGGTDDIKKVVSQADIDRATEALKARVAEGTQEALSAKLKTQGYIPFESSYKVDSAPVTANQQPNTEADQVTVAGKNTFTLVGVNRDELDTYIKDKSREDIDDSAQTVSDSGLDGATVRLTEKSPGVYDVSVDTQITIGPQLNVDTLAQEILGKNYRESEASLSAKPGVVDTDIEYSPFWVNTTPKDANKVRITVENIDQDE